MSRAQIEDDIFISSHVCPIFADPISFGLMFYVFNCKNINLFTKKSDNHNVNTRNKDKLAVPNIRLYKVSKSFTRQSLFQSKRTKIVYKQI